jgi:hypothetical protein
VIVPNVTKEATAKVTGGVRFAAIACEAQSVPLFRKGAAFEGKKRITVTPTTIEIFIWVKGGTGATYTADITLNSKTKTFKGAVGGTGQIKRTETVPFADFGL